MRPFYILCALALFCCVSCGKKQHASFETDASGLPVIHLQADYPEKEIVLQDVAEVEYIPLETTEESLIGAASEILIKGDTIVIWETKQDKVLFFDRTGKLLSAIRHVGSGGEEYQAGMYLSVDFDRQELLILDNYVRYRIQVYDFQGNFLRTLPLSRQVWPEQLLDYDKDYLLGYDTKDMHEVWNGKQAPAFPYFLVSKQDGRVVSVPLEIVQRKSNRYFYCDSEGRGTVTTIHIVPLVRYAGGVVIADLAGDTVYHYINHKLVPLAMRRSSHDHPGLLSTLQWMSDRYWFFQMGEIELDTREHTLKNISSRMLLYDRKACEVHEAKLLNRDLPMSNFAANDNCLPSRVMTALYSASRIVENRQKGNVKGDLARIADRISEEDNPVLMIAKFKE